MIYLPSLVSLPTNISGVFRFIVETNFDNQFLNYKSDSKLFYNFQSAIRGIVVEDVQEAMVLDKSSNEANQWAWQKIQSFPEKIQEELALRLTSNRKSWGDKSAKEILHTAVENQSVTAPQILSYCAGYGLLEDYDFSNSIPIPYKNGVVYLQTNKKENLILVNKNNPEEVAFVNQQLVTYGTVNQNFEVTLTHTKKQLEEDVIWQVAWEDGMEENLELTIVSKPVTKKVVQIQLEAKDLTPTSLASDERLNNPSFEEIGISILEQNISIPHMNLLVENTDYPEQNITTIEDPVVGLYTYAHCVGNKMFNPNVNGASHRITSLIHKHKQTNQGINLTLTLWPNLFE